MADRCIDCGTRPKLNQQVPYFTESFAIRTQTGGATHIQLRLCFSCGARFPSRGELRSYLAKPVPQYGLEPALAAAR